ncbi:hypothetical protein ACFVXQ_28930 [Kitasatospora sp. NPDC058263]
MQTITKTVRTTTTVTTETAVLAAGCGCSPAPAPAVVSPDVLQARAITRHLYSLGIAPARISAAWDAALDAAAVRIDSPHGLYTLTVPQVGRPFPVWFLGARTVLSVRRVPATTDASVALHLATHLRDRGDL